MASVESTIKLTIRHRGTSHVVDIPPESTVAVLQASLEELTSIPPHLQKLLVKGKKLSAGDETLQQAGLKNGQTIQLFGSTPAELGEVKGTEDEKQRRERIMRDRASKSTPKVRSTTKADSSTLSYRFHRIEPLQHLPDPASAQSLLQRLADDPAIQHIMQKHEFSVGVLTELAPHEHPELLGLNVNAGQSIKLRLRTDTYDGFRLYSEVRRVLVHELTHNRWGDHDNKFKELNSRLNRQIAEYERNVREGTHSLSGYNGPAYEPSSLESDAYTLGDSSIDVFAQEDRRQRVLAATLRRLQKEEEELEDSCGTAGKAAGSQ